MQAPSERRNGSGFVGSDAPRWDDYSRCIRCGLCLNQCPTYRELGFEMDSPRGRIYQMAQVDEGRLPIGESFVRHIDLCLDCRACETACPSGVEYGKLVEAARAQIEQHYRRPFGERMLRYLAFHHLISKPGSLKVAGALLRFYQSSGLEEMVNRSGLLNSMPRLCELQQLTPAIESPSFFPQIGKVFPARGSRRFRVALHAGCIANLAFARLNETTVRVLQENGCEVTIAAGQICCGALPVHAGLRGLARDLARRNIEAFDAQPFDAILTNAAGCGSTLKEYGYLLKDDAVWAGKAASFSAKMRDVTEFLCEVGLTAQPPALPAMVTYQDSCHLAHGQKVRQQPRKLLNAIPGLRFVEMPLSDLCCGSAGIYNITETEVSMQLLRSKMEAANSTGASIIATANPGCILQLRAGAKLYGTGQRVMHVIELLDPARPSL
ncbi:MAG: (Fe-S)-binding protein [Acidobacteria bacterium]|nr:(Fe-S)-binding protein [Acidobacteriota bacterium]